MLYPILKFILRIAFKLFYRISVAGLDNVPAEGPVILVANHASVLDPLVLGVALKRRIVFMAKAELFRIPVLRTVIRALGAFPVKRGQVDRGAWMTAIATLNNGKVLGIFPEGTRTEDGSIGEAQSGAARLALKTGAVVVPVGIHGTYGALKKGTARLHRTKITVKIGQGMRFEPDPDGRINKLGIEKASTQIMESIKALSALGFENR